MRRHWWRIAGMLALLAVATGCGGGGHKGIGKNAGGSAEVTEQAVRRYLNELRADRPQVVRDVTIAVNEGRTYRQGITDIDEQRATLTVWVDRDEQEILNATIYRDVICPKCKGSGSTKRFDFVADRGIPVEFTCLECEGKGKLPNVLTRRKWVLSPNDYVNPDLVIAENEERAYGHAPPETERYVQMLASEDPRQRLEACEWLNDNYIRKGVFFRQYEPVLNRARWIQPDHERGVRVYQFWAGKDLPGAEARTYWRVYVDLQSGKVTRTSWVAERKVKR